MIWFRPKGNHGPPTNASYYPIISSCDLWYQHREGRWEYCGEHQNTWRASLEFLDYSHKTDLSEYGLYSVSAVGVTNPFDPDLEIDVGL